MNSHMQMVGDFHQKFELVGLDPASEPRTMSPDLFLFRFDLIFEESAEILRAFRKRDLPGVADGIGDLLYVTYGYAQMANIDVGSSHMYENAVFSKAAFVSDEEFALGFAYLTLNIGGLASTVSAKERGYAVGSALEAILDDCYALAHKMSIPIDLVFREIQRANMSKERSTGDGDGRSTRGSKFDVVKPAGFVPPRIKEVLDGTV